MRSMRLRLLLAGCALLSFGGAAAAAPTASVANDFEDKVLACAACHGTQGRSDSESYYPSIAGKPAGYLYHQFINFRDGRRQNVVMRDMFAYMSDDYLRKIADYYAQQDASTASSAAPVSAADLERGRQLTEHGDPAHGIPACSACHGAELAGVKPAVPGLLGLNMEYLSAQMGAWQTGTRHAASPDCMAAVAKKLTTTDIVAVSAWLATRPRPQHYAPAETPPAQWPLECGGVQ